MLSNNPLRQYFRQPAIYIRLPSGGNWYPDGTLDLPPTNEIPVYPMTAIDEITYRTPDALFNGSAVVSVIQSCIPNIRNAWVMPAIDVDTVLISIRIASYGHEMESNSKCPSCNHEAEYVIDLRTLLDVMKSPDYNTPVVSGDMEFYFRPITYQDLNENNQLQFQEQRMLQAIASADMPEEEKVSTVGDALKKITEITVKAMAQSISAVKTPTALVTEREFIDDLLKNCNRALFTKLRDHIIKLKGSTEIQPMTIKCNECSTEYQQAVTLDVSSFFGDAS
jgi:hypothetical protein